jgi:hypothetical protein
MISVRALGDGNFAVIDGMHRVTCLQLLCKEKHLGIDYEHVPLPPHSNRTRKHMHYVDILKPYLS